jgi:hypothetical protein
MFGINPEDIKKRSENAVKTAKEMGKQYANGIPDKGYMAVATRLYNIYEYLKSRENRKK